MLQKQTVSPNTLALLKQLSADSAFAEYRLVGGTALALQIGHRISVDLDFFRCSNDEKEFGWEVWAAGRADVIPVKASAHVHVYDIDSVRVDIVELPYAWLEPAVEIETLRLAALLDIAAMKLAAITNRGNRKDFVDLGFLLERFSLKQMFDAYQRRYPTGNLLLVLKSLSFFDGALEQPMPRMLSDISWETLRGRIDVAVQTMAIG